MLVQTAEVEYDDRFHVAQFGSPRSATLCGKFPVSFGSMLPFNERVWPEGRWCDECRLAYSDATQPHME